MFCRLTLALLLLPWAECGMCCGGMYATNYIGNTSCPVAYTLATMPQNNTYRQCDQLCCVSHCVGRGTVPSMGQLPPSMYVSQCVKNQSEWTSAIRGANAGWRAMSDYQASMFSNSISMECALECASFTSASVVSAAPMLVTAILASLITLLAQRPIE